MRTRGATGSLAAALFGAAAFVALPACSDTRDESDPGSGDRDAAPDARRVKERNVAIKLAMLATREMTRGDDGKPVFGDLVPLDGANVCIVRRRDAFAVFQPFEPVDPPRCVPSVAGEIVEIPDAPANSDLIVTAEYEGLRPLVMTDRTIDDPVEAPPGTDNFSLVLLKPGATEPWLGPAGEPGAREGTVALLAIMLWSGTVTPRPELLTGHELLWGHQVGIAEAAVPASVEPAGGGAEIDAMSALAGVAPLSLPEGSARVTFRTDNPRVSCMSTGSWGGVHGELLGLPADVNSGLELPVLAGHDQIAAMLCFCRDGPDDGELLDLATCRFAPKRASDGGLAADGG